MSECLETVSPSGRSVLASRLLRILYSLLEDMLQEDCYAANVMSTGRSIHVRFCRNTRLRTLLALYSGQSCCLFQNIPNNQTLSQLKKDHPNLALIW